MLTVLVASKTDEKRDRTEKAEQGRRGALSVLAASSVEHSKPSLCTAVRAKP